MQFEIERDDGDQRKYIRDVQEIPDRDGRSVQFSWRWPQDPAYCYCFAYTVTEQELKEGASLASFAQSGKMPVIISEQAAHVCKILLRDTAQRTFFYPARLVRDGYVVLNQAEGNRSALFRKKLTVTWRADYGTLGGFFGPKLKSVRLQLNFSSAEKPDGVLVYHCKGGGRDRTRYGIPISECARNAVFSFVVGPNETVELETGSEELAQRIELRKQE